VQSDPNSMAICVQPISHLTTLDTVPNLHKVFVLSRGSLIALLTMDVIGHNVYTHPSTERCYETIVNEAQNGICWNARKPTGFDDRLSGGTLLTQVSAQPTEEPIRTTDFVNCAEVQTDLEKSTFQPTDFALYAQDYTVPVQIPDSIPIPPTNFADYARQYAQIAPLPLNNPFSMLDTGHTHSNFNEDHTWSQDLIS
jgi:hypothetical protein